MRKKFSQIVESGNRLKKNEARLRFFFPRRNTKPFATTTVRSEGKNTHTQKMETREKVYFQSTWKACRASVIRRFSSACERVKKEIRTKQKKKKEKKKTAPPIHENERRTSAGLLFSSRSSRNSWRNEEFRTSVARQSRPIESRYSVKLGITR